MSKRINKHARWHDAPADADGRHRFEHWCVDNQVCFITARVRVQHSAFTSADAKGVYWERFDHYTGACGFEPWITSLMDNHYHTLGFLHEGEKLKVLMQRVHGSVAKLVNDVLESQCLPRHADFWCDQRGQQYFDGCIRDERQFRRAWRYVERQAERQGICRGCSTYPHTRAIMSFEGALKSARERDGFMAGVPYMRYLQKRAFGG
jgi:hypothetical protein